MANTIPSNDPTPGDPVIGGGQKGVKSALVVGGSGFIGRHLIAALANSGAYRSIRSLDLVEPASPCEGVSYGVADVRSPLEAAIEGPIDEIYNLAAVHRTPGHLDHEYFETNVLGALHTCALARRAQAKTIVFTSSIAVYGPCEETKTEDSPLEPVSAYGRSKLLAEHIHRDWQAQSPDRRLAIVRPAVIFGPHEGGNMTRLAKFQSTGWFFFPGRTDTLKACGYVQELIRSMRFAVDRAEPELTYNFCYPKCYSVAEIADTYVAHGGLPKVRGVIPRGVAMGGAMAFEALGLFGVRTPINRARMKKMLESTNIAPNKLQEIGYEFATDLAAAVADWKRSSATGRLE